MALSLKKCKKQQEFGSLLLLCLFKAFCEPLNGAGTYEAHILAVVSLFYLDYFVNIAGLLLALAEEHSVA